MRMKTYKWALVTAAAVVLSSLTACGGSSSGTDSSNEIAAPDDCTPKGEVETVKDGTLTVAIAENPPVVITSGGRFDGLEPILIEKFAADYCLALQVDTMSFAATIPAVQSGRADMAAGGYYRTAEREKVVDLSAPIWLDQLGIIAEAKVDTISDLDGMKVGTVDGYLWVPDLQKTLGSELTIYPSNVEMKADLEAGRIEVAVDSLSLASGYEGYESAAAQPDDRVASTINPAQVGWPYAKGNAALGDALDGAIAEWHDDGSIVTALDESGLPASLADTGAPRIIQ